MKTLVALAISVITLAGLGLALPVCAQQTALQEFTFHGDRYRLSRVNSMVMLGPEGKLRPLTTPLGPDAQLARCDEFVASVLEKSGLKAGGQPGFVRARAETQTHGAIFVMYDQQHQGYAIQGAGARVELTRDGRVAFAGLTYESESLRTFRPRNLAALEKLAARAVPHPRVALPIESGLVIDPRGDAPAQICAAFVFRVRRRGEIEGWQVMLDAETGKVLSSLSTVLNAQASSR